MKKIILLFLVLAISVFADAPRQNNQDAKQDAKQDKQAAKQKQRPAFTVPDKLSRNQQAQLNIYLEINKLVLGGKYDTRKYFLAYHKSIAESNKAMISINQREAHRLNERFQLAIQNNKPELAKRCQKASQLYVSMAALNKDICDAYEKCDIGKMTKSLSSYLELETSLVAVGAKPCPREWFTTREAEYVISVISARQRNDKR